MRRTSREQPRSHRQRLLTPPSLTESQNTISTGTDISNPLLPEEKTALKKLESNEQIPLIRSICRKGEGVDPFHLQCPRKNLLHMYINVNVLRSLVFPK